jgi:hypothetical protein
VAFVEPPGILDLGLKKFEWSWIHIIYFAQAWHDTGISRVVSTKHENAGSVIERRSRGSTVPVFKDVT